VWAAVSLNGDHGVAWNRSVPFFVIFIVIEIYGLKGKSYWIFYAMCRRLAERKPVMWYRGSMERLFLFVEEGVYLAPSIYPFTELKNRVWTLIDADLDEYEGTRLPDSCRVPPNLAVQDTKNLVIYTTPLQRGRWKRLGQTTRRTFAVMNPWTREEISQALAYPFLFSISRAHHLVLCSAVIHGLTGREPAIEDMYNRFGPTPRACFDFLKDESLLSAYEDCCRCAIKALSSHTLRCAVIDPFDMDAGTLTFLIVRRENIRGDTNWATMSVEPITHSVEMALRDWLQTLTRDDQIETYEWLVKVGKSRRIPDLVFESLAETRDCSTMRKGEFPSVLRYFKKLFTAKH
jgi:hypothetical protein